MAFSLLYFWAPVCFFGLFVLFYCSTTRRGIMDHGPSTDWGEDKSAASKARLGVYLFIAYALVYAGFVAITVYNVTLWIAKSLLHKLFHPTASSPRTEHQTGRK
jgi:hypothetical protein